MPNNNTLKTMVQHIKSQRPGMVAGMVSMGVFALVGFVWTATTISTNISTDGNLTVGGDTTLGNVTITSSAALLLGSNGSASSVTTTGGAVWYDGSNFYGNANGTATQLDNASGGSSEIWKLGNSSSDTTPDFTGGATYAVKLTTQFFTGRYLFFPPPPTSKVIQSVKYYIYESTGTYSGDVDLSLKIYDMSGNAVHTVTASDPAVSDMEAVATSTWQTLSLSGTTANKTIENTEQLGIGLTLDGDAGGDANITVIAEVTVE